MILACLIQGDEQYGSRTACKTLLSSLKEAGVDCRVLSLSDGDLPRECASLGLPVINLHREPIPSLRGSLVHKAVQLIARRRKDAKTRRAVTAALARTRADALNFWQESLVGIAGSAARANGIKSLWHMSNVISGRYPFAANRRVYQFQCNRYGVVPLSNSAYTASTLGNSPVRPHVLHLSIDPEQFRPGSEGAVSRLDLGIPEAAIVVGSIARLEPSKGQALLLQAVFSLLDEGHDLHLVMCGGPTKGAFYDSLTASVAQSRHRGRIHLLGPVHAPERYYALMNLTVSSSVLPEGFGLSVVESMMSGRPCLIHALGGPAETVIDDVTGWHYGQPTVEALVGGLRRAISARARWPDMGQAARAHALQHFSPEAQVSRYLQIVRAVTNRDGGRKSVADLCHLG